jgi:hypothetical protein
VTLNGREPATVTAEVTGVAPMTVTVPAVDPFTVSLQLLSTTPTTGQPVGVLVNAATTREVPNAPAPTAVLVDCGNGETLTPALGALAQCRYGTAGPYVITGTASANGFATNATAALTVTPAPNLTPPTPVGPLGPAVTLTATELHKTPTTATWRFRATASGGDHSGDWQFFVDYVQSPASGATPQTRTSSSDTVDVTYQANGTKQIRVAGNVGGSTVTGETTIIVTFGP